MCIFSFVPDILIFEMSSNFILFFPMIFVRYHVENVFFLKINGGLYAQYNAQPWNLSELGPPLSSASCRSLLELLKNYTI